MYTQAMREAQKRYNESPKGKANRQRYNKSPKGREYQRQYYATQRGQDLRRSRKLKFNYGITLAERDAMLAAQGGACAVCRDPSPGPRGWCVDHCHETEAVRGIVCNSCNLMLGYSRDNPDTLLAAVEYLKNEK